MRSGLIAGVSAYVMWGLLTIYWKNLHGFPPFELIGWRIFASFCVLAPLVIWHKRLRIITTAMRSKELGWRLFAASILVTINWSSYVWAVAHDHVIETALGYFIAPVFTMLLGFIILREPVRASHRIIILLTTVAIAILTYSYGQPPWRALLIATSWSIYGYLKKQVKLTSLESLSGEVIVLLLPAIGLVTLTFSRTDSVPNMATGIEWVLVLLTGLMTAIPLLMFGAASRRVRLSVLGPMQFLVPTFNFLLGWLVYSEELNALRLVGFAFVWVGLAIFFADSYKTTKTNS